VILLGSLHSSFAEAKESLRHMTGDTLTVRFRKARAAAGPERYGRMPIGSAAWVDRLLNNDEPFVLKQQMDASDAANTIAVLRNLCEVCRMPGVRRGSGAGKTRRTFGRVY